MQQPASLIDRDVRLAAPLGDLPDRVQFLCEAAAFDRPHSGATLLGHLIGTYELLASWQCRQELCDAGLFHSLYGTEAYPTALVAAGHRARLRALIGTPAEELVWTFCDMSLEYFTLALTQAGESPRAIAGQRAGAMHRLDYPSFRDLCHLAAANLIEQHDRIRADRRPDLRNQLTRLAAHVSHSAAQAIASLPDLR